MSHILTIKTECRDIAAISAACRRLGLDAPVTGEVAMYSGKVTGTAVQLKGWRYPIVCNTATGQIQFDNYNGRWGDQKHLDAFKQIYAVCKATLEARKKGYQVTERKLKDGSIKLEVTVQ